ncbi:MAG TPA: hypothetical protein VED46_13540 [Alphaproteobacteria bacterium]|nr:hypothetical protein [Alphaproteobacteria bacterium]
MSKVVVLAVAFALMTLASAHAGGCKVFGNNGWGNDGGLDGTNGGSSQGTQSTTKFPDEER